MINRSTSPRAQNGRAAKIGRSPFLMKTPSEHIPDVDMESVESRTGQQEDHDPDDLIFKELRRPLVVKAGTATISGFTTQRICVSAITELKEFSGRNEDEDRARGWMSKVKSAFLRDQASDSKMCLVFGDLLTGPARNRYAQSG